MLPPASSAPLKHEYVTVPPTCAKSTGCPQLINPFTLPLSSRTPSQPEPLELPTTVILPTSARSWSTTSPPAASVRVDEVELPQMRQLRTFAAP